MICFTGKKQRSQCGKFAAPGFPDELLPWFGLKSAILQLNAPILLSIAATIYFVMASGIMQQNLDQAGCKKYPPSGTNGSNTSK